MGCLKLTYQQNGPLLKCVWRKPEPEKPVQWFYTLDPVAIESVGYDFLRTEFNGVNKHDPVNNEWEDIPNMFGVDDYLHQAADRANWPEGIIYDPDNSGIPVPVLGTHEHWNNPVDKQYSRNLGTGKGIELVSIPEGLVKGAKRN